MKKKWKISFTNMDLCLLYKTNYFVIKDNIIFDNSIKDFTSYYIMNKIVMTKEESPRAKIKKYNEKVPKTTKTTKSFR